LKEKLLSAVSAARAREQELVNAAADVVSDPDGRWNAKDHLAHMAWWRQRDGQLIDAVRTGSAPPPAAGSREGQEEGRQNAVIHRTYRDHPLQEIRDFASSTWEKFGKAVEACSEEDLSRPHPYAADEVLWQTVLGICYHTGEHLTYWYQDGGDEARVEAAQRWLRDIYRAVAPDARHRAYASYNLACFYARRGRVDGALPLLRESLGEWGELATWARQDSDLDPIRENPELRELLAT
jgi:hypothetical protein